MLGAGARRSRRWRRRLAVEVELGRGRGAQRCEAERRRRGGDGTDRRGLGDGRRAVLEAVQRRRGERDRGGPLEREAVWHARRQPRRAQQAVDVGACRVRPTAAVLGRDAGGGGVLGEQVRPAAALLLEACCRHE
eukprot:1357137-Prymnesium_polylepis.1